MTMIEARDLLQCTILSSPKYKLPVMVNVILEQAMKAQRGSKGIDLLCF